jgi:hypothetical protein
VLRSQSPWSLIDKEGEQEAKWWRKREVEKKKRRRKRRRRRDESSTEEGVRRCVHQWLP